MKARLLAIRVVALILSVGLLIVFFEEVSEPLHNWSLTAPSERPRIPSLLSLHEFQPPPRQEFTEILSRPPFAASRRPPPVSPSPAAAQVQPATPPLPNFILVGTIIGPQATIAIIKASGASDTQRVSVGQTVAGWEVAQIFKDRVLFRAGTTEQEVKSLPPSQLGNASGNPGRSAIPFRPGAAISR